MPYFWRYKGKHWQTKAFAKLANKVDPSSSDPLETGGRILYLPSVPIPIDTPTLDRDALVRDAVGRFRVITAEEIMSIGIDTDE